ncbi:MAG: TetR/AcrR family transcriptional regulator [Clostridia bacterium]|nr:TetR/AcrR family transcriptional regulator [Clostridia bacterium]
MPKGFTEREKEIINKKLIEKGKEFLSIYGIKKTSVEDLTRAAGISKGAFYVFYNSKEELFFEIFEQFEKEIKEQLFGDFIKSGEVTKSSFKTLVRNALEVLASHPIMKSLNKEELEYLMRKLPPEKLQSHMNEDTNFTTLIYEMLDKKGIIRECDPEILSGMFRGLAFMCFHKDDIGSDIFPEVINLFADMISNYFLKD